MPAVRFKWVLSKWQVESRLGVREIPAVQAVVDNVAVEGTTFVLFPSLISGLVLSNRMSQHAQHKHKAHPCFNITPNLVRTCRHAHVKHD